MGNGRMDMHPSTRNDTKLCMREMFFFLVAKSNILM